MALRLEDVAMGTAAVSHLKLLIPKLYFEAKTPVFTPFLYRLYSYVWNIYFSAQVHGAPLTAQ